MSYSFKTFIVIILCFSASDPSHHSLSGHNEGEAGRIKEIYSSANAIMQGYFFAFAKVLLSFQIPAFQGCIIMEQHLFGPDDMVLQS